MEFFYFIKKYLLGLLIFMLVALGLFGCAGPVLSTPGNLIEGSNGAEAPGPYQGPPSPVFSSVSTTEKVFSLVFTGMADEETMVKLLDALEVNDLKGTFFVPGMRVAEEPDLARSILERGHELQNYTLNQKELTQLDYEEIYREIQLSAQVIERETKTQPHYVAAKFGGYNEDVLMAAAQAQNQTFVSFSLNLLPSYMETAEGIEAYFRKNLQRGSILALHTEGKGLIDGIPLIAAAAEEIGYQEIRLTELSSYHEEKLPLEAIEGFDAAQVNFSNQGADYQVITKGKGTQKKVALTFDDWGTDFTITRILDTLEAYDVKATFFLRTNGVQGNPNLAKAIFEQGHEIANHTYSHPVITQISAEELQEEIVRSHQILTEAIQKQPSLLFRPPTGAYDDQTARIVAATGYSTIVMYDVTTFDWDPKKTKEDITNSILEETTAGSIILLHLLDGLATPDALPGILEGLGQRGYEFVTVGEMMQNE